MIIFSLIDLMDVQKCYDFLCTILHPQGLKCPKCQCSVQDSKIQRRDRAPVLIYECKNGHFYNLFTKTVWQGTHHKCPIIIRILQGVAQGVSTLHLSQELVRDRKHLLKCRHKLQNFVNEASIRIPLPDTVSEVDEMYQNAGEKVSSISIRMIRRVAVATKLAAMVPGILIALRFWVSLAGKVVKFNWKLNIIVREKTVNPLYSRPRNQGQRTIQMNGERTITSRKLIVYM